MTLYLVPLPADSNSCVITRSEVVTVREITRWQNKSQNGGSIFYYVFRLLVSLVGVSNSLFPVYCYRWQRPDHTQRSKLWVLSYFLRKPAKLTTCTCGRDLRLHAGNMEYRNLSRCKNRWVLQDASSCRQGTSVTRKGLFVRLLCVLLAAADLLQPSVSMRGFTPPYPPYLIKERSLSTQQF